MIQDRQDVVAHLDLKSLEQQLTTECVIFQGLTLEQTSCIPPHWFSRFSQSELVRLYMRRGIVRSSGSAFVDRLQSKVWYQKCAQNCQAFHDVGKFWSDKRRGLKYENSILGEANISRNSALCRHILWDVLDELVSFADDRAGLNEQELEADSFVCVWFEQVHYYIS